MTTKRILGFTVAALWAALTTPCLAIAWPQRSAETVAQAAPSPTLTADQNESLSKLQETVWAPISGPLANPFAAFASSPANGGRDLVYGAAVAATAPPAYPVAAPAPPSSSSSWRPTHFEIYGDVQWRNLSSNSGFSSSYCLPS